jgi:hypothetical protein
MTSTPNSVVTDEMVEAAAKAMCIARRPSHPTCSDGELFWKRHGGKDLYRDIARIGLEAALSQATGCAVDYRDEITPEQIAEIQKIADKGIGNKSDFIAVESEQWPQEANDANRKLLDEIVRLQAVIDQATGCERKMREALERVVTDWDALPGPRHYTPTETNKWLRGYMKPAIDNARQALSAPPTPCCVEDGWRPIKDAPKDGTEILAIAFADTLQIYWIVFWNGESFECVSSGRTVSPFTHWQQLPKPPTISKVVVNESASPFPQEE